MNNITVKGARVNNLKNVDVEIPRNQLVVITGLSGSGKSSLAFDTLYAEGRRRYVESLSAYARQFLGRLNKPECDSIKGLPPAIAIEQKVNTRNPRSTVGTSTEIYDYIRMLFGRVGHTYSPVSGVEVKKHSVEDVLATAATYPEGSRAAIVAPITLPEGRTLPQQLDIYTKEGFTRVVTPEAAFVDISDYDSTAVPDLLIDRLALRREGDELSRLAESAETAFFEGHGRCRLLVWNADGKVDMHEFSVRFEADGITFPEPSDQMFNFNNPMGACPVCEGFGKTLDISEELVIPDESLSIFDDAVASWRGPKSKLWKNEFIHAVSASGFPVHKPYWQLSAEEKHLLWRGDGDKVKGIMDYFDWVSTQRQAIEYRMILARYRGKTTCHACGGSRLRPEASYVRVGGATVSELVRMPVDKLRQWFADLSLGERDTERLIGVLRRLQRLGNTVVVVEHDEEIMRAADRIIDVGPAAGRLGGEIVFQGAPADLEKVEKSYTMQYLSGRLSIPVPGVRRKWRDSIRITGATEHNLKNIDAQFPLGVMTAVTGVSGSGKSTLVRDIFFRAMARAVHDEGDAPGRFRKLEGDIKRVADITFVDQNPIGRSTRSNPATYLKAYDEIRQLMASQQAAKQLDLTPASFSFNTEGGRCEACKGEGYITIEMQFLADVTIECEQCHGKRFKQEVLEVKYNGKNISDILDLTVDEAIEFFSTEQRIVRRLLPLQEVGLGYIKLGQSSSTLSGGENQRVKLAYFLSQDHAGPTIFIFDEPTTGLHFHDIRLLTKAFDRLIAMGHTIIVVEHNLDVIKCADWIIDMGPEGGEGGGQIVATGTPETVAANPASITGHYLAEKLG